MLTGFQTMLRIPPLGGLAISAILLLFFILPDLSGVQGIPRPLRPQKMKQTPNVTQKINHGIQSASNVIQKRNNETLDNLFANYTDPNVNSSLKRTKRASLLQSRFQSDQQNINGYAFDDFFHTSGDLSGTYTTETLPDDLGTLHPNQWIFFRVCTQPLEPRNYYPDGIEEQVREKIKYSSCLSTDIKRPVFGRNQNLIVAVRGAPAVQFEILNRRTHILQPTFETDLVKFWLHRSRDTVLVGLRPQAKHNHQIMELRLETYLRPDKTDPSLQMPPPRWKSKNTGHFNQSDVKPSKKLLKDVAPLMTPTISDHLSQEIPGGTRFQAETVHTVYLRQFTLRFLQDQLKLFLRCNKTGPFIMYDPSPTETERYIENSTYQPSSDGNQMPADNIGSYDVGQTVDTSVQPKEIKRDSNLLEQAIREYLSGSTSRLSTISTDLLLDTDTPEPIAITEAMDESAIRLAQPYIDPNLVDIEEHTVSTLQLTSQSLLVPTEPTTRTLVQVVQVGEILHFTCQGFVPDGQLRILYEQDAWQELRIPFLSFHNVDGSDQELQVLIQATRITWANITQASLDHGIRQIDALTNVKCGSYRSSQLLEHPLRTYVQKPNPVEQLYFVIVSPEDYSFITHHMAEKLTDTFEPMRPVSVSSKAENEQTNVLRVFLPDVIETTKSEISKHQNIGFWNLSLSKLSTIKLFFTVSMVILIISGIVLIIRNYGKIRTELPRSSVVSRWDDSGQGDAPSLSQNKTGHSSRATGSSLPRIRIDMSPSRGTLEMTNSNAADEMWYVKKKSKLSNQEASWMLMESVDFIQHNAGLIRRPKRAKE